MNGCLGVILSEMIHPNSSFMNISAQSDASGHQKDHPKLHPEWSHIIPWEAEASPITIQPMFGTCKAL